MRPAPSPECRLQIDPEHRPAKTPNGSASQLPNGCRIPGPRILTATFHVDERIQKLWRCSTTKRGKVTGLIEFRLTATDTAQFPHGLCNAPRPGGSDIKEQTSNARPSNLTSLPVWSLEDGRPRDDDSISMNPHYLPRESLLEDMEDLIHKLVVSLTTPEYQQLDDGFVPVLAAQDNGVRLLSSFDSASTLPVSIAQHTVQGDTEGKWIAKARCPTQSR
ncbi:hypothetical protein G7Y89_g10614 [Cudoniella acicularis]|uniref:Uncharacterized protein n=1 Tax=Cudoniella acicularis TaxID=354080 RepID=A0A8H4RDY9_9HELO|nr:hypothetical protein G7Y89_g10614 [Cudoniella acicularis]